MIQNLNLLRWSNRIPRQMTPTPTHPLKGMGDQPHKPVRWHSPPPGGVRGGLGKFSIT